MAATNTFYIKVLLDSWSQGRKNLLILIATYLLLATCLAYSFDTEYGGSMFLQNVG
jgi:hypothetical protein